MPITEPSTTKPESKNEWRTPVELFTPLQEEFSFQYDFAATRENYLASRYFTKHDSALDDRDWFYDRTVPPFGWLNPPFNMFMEFLTKANEQIELAGRMYGYGVICCVVKADAPETKWWRHNVIDENGHARHEIRYLYPRVNYVNSLGVKVKGVNFPTALVIMRPTPWRHITWVKWQRS